MKADTKILIGRLLDAALLCFDENDQPADYQIENIVNKGLHTFCSVQVLHGKFLHIK